MWNQNDGILASTKPTPLTFAIPALYTQTIAGGPILTDSSHVTFQLNPPLIIPANSNCILTSASFCFSQPNVAGLNDKVLNISNGNNRITITYGALPAQDYYVPLGLYGVDDLQLALNQIAITAEWIDGTIPLFVLTGIAATQKVVFTLNPAGIIGPPASEFPSPNFIVSFENPSPANPSNNDSMGPLLGFPTSGPDSTITAMGGTSAPDTTPAPNVANFANISSYNLYMSILTSSYLNGIAGQLLYSFPIGAYTPNSIVPYQPTLKLPIQCNSNIYSTVDIWTTDQSGNPLPWKYYQSPFSFSCIISKNSMDGSI